MIRSRGNGGQRLGAWSAWRSILLKSTGQGKARFVAALVALMALVGAPSVASADIFTFWASGKANTFGGSGDIFQNFDNRFGGGAELGIELIGIDIFGEAIVMGFDQYLFTANAGFDFTVGDRMRLTMGAFTGPLFFLFPPSAEAGQVDFSTLPSDQQQALEAATGLTVAEAEAQFDQFAEQEQDLSRLAVGWNIVRARMDLDVKLVPGVYLGLTGQAGYHMLLSGEAIAAGAKNEALDRFAQENGLPDDVKDAIGDAIGAEPVDRNNLDGFNFEVQLHLKLEFGT